MEAAKKPAPVLPAGTIYTSRTYWAATAQDALGYLLNVRPSLMPGRESSLVGVGATMANARHCMRELGLASSGSATVLFNRLMAACERADVDAHQGLPIGHPDGYWGEV